MVLQSQEANLINLLRFKYRFGDVYIEMHEGLPTRIKKTEVFDDLRGDLNKTNPDIN